jgi:hypothetical protein
MFHLEFSGYVYNNLHAKFHMHTSIGSLVTFIKPQINYGFHIVAMLFYIQQQNYFHKSLLFFKGILLQKIQNPILSSTDIAPTQGYFFAGPPFRKFFLRRTQARMAFQNLFPGIDITNTTPL